MYKVIWLKLGDTALNISTGQSELEEGFKEHLFSAQIVKDRKGLHA